MKLCTVKHAIRPGALCLMLTSACCAACGKLVCDQCSTRRNWGKRGKRWRRRVCRRCQEEKGLLHRRAPKDNPVELTRARLQGFLRVAERVIPKGVSTLGDVTEFNERHWVHFMEFVEWAENEDKKLRAEEARLRESA